MMTKPNHVAATGDEKLDRILSGKESKGDSYRFFGIDPLHELGIMRSTVPLSELEHLVPILPRMRPIKGVATPARVIIIIDTETGKNSE